MIKEEDLTVKERLFLRLFREGIDILQQELNVAELQEKYNAYQSQVLMIEVKDLRIPPIYLQVKDGQIRRTFKYDGKPDARVSFRTMDGLLNILDGNITIDDIFCWDGMVFDNGKMVKEVDFEGDFYKGSIILKDVLDNYLFIIRRILHEQMKITGFAIRTVAKIKKVLNRDPNLDAI